MTKEKAELLVRTIGLIVSNSQVYGPDHGVTQNVTDQFYALLSDNEEEQGLDFNITDEGLKLNGTSVECSNPVMRAFIEHVNKREISNFTLKSEMSREQFRAFLEAILANEEELTQLGGFSGAISALKLDTVVTSRKVSYIEVNEDEIVVDKDKVKNADAEKAASVARQKEEAMAVLRGEEHNTESGEAGLRDLSSDTDSLSSLIVESAKAKDADKENVASEIIACLHRLYIALTNDPAFHTQKKKKQIHKTLLSLEEEILAKLKSAEGEGNQHDVDNIHDTIESMNDELTIDSLSQEYAKKRNAIGNSEKRLLRFMRNKGVDKIEESNLQSRLIDGGLALEDWQELLAKSGIIQQSDGTLKAISDDPSTNIEDPGVSFENLAKLLSKVTSDVSGASAMGTDGMAQDDEQVGTGTRAIMIRVPEAVLKNDLQAVQEEVNNIILSAEKRIAKLVSEVEGSKDEADKDGNERPELSRDRLFEILGEIGQELCQPLAVIKCSLDSLGTGRLGEVNHIQKEMINLSSDSSAKLKKLIDKIISISGQPEALEVNKEIQAELYR